MPRLPRVVLPGIPHHVTQRGNNRGQMFFEDGDYAIARATPSLQLLESEYRKNPARCVWRVLERDDMRLMHSFWPSPARTTPPPLRGTSPSGRI